MPEVSSPPTLLTLDSNLPVKPEKNTVQSDESFEIKAEKIKNELKVRSAIGMGILTIVILVLVILFATKVMTMFSTGADIGIMLTIWFMGMIYMVLGYVAIDSVVNKKLEAERAANISE